MLDDFIMNFSWDEFAEEYDELQELLHLTFDEN